MIYEHADENELEAGLCDSTEGAGYRICKYECVNYGGTAVSSTVGKKKYLAVVFNAWFLHCCHTTAQRRCSSYTITLVSEPLRAAT